MRKNYIVGLRAVTVAGILALAIQVTVQGHVMEWDYIVCAVVS